MIIPDLEAVYLELRMLGTFMSAIAYGIVIVLSGNCILLLQKKRGIYSNRMRLLLFIYVVVMLLLSTLAIIQSIWGLALLTFHRHVNLFKLPLYALVENTTSTLPLTIWGADGFMVSIILLRRNEDFHEVATTDMALCRLVSGCNWGPQDFWNCPTFIPFNHFVGYVKFSSHSSQFLLLMKSEDAV